MSSSERLAIEFDALAPLDTNAIWAEDSLLCQTLTSSHDHTEFAASTTICITDGFSCWPQDCKE